MDRRVEFEPTSQQPELPSDAARIRWPLVICCFAITAVHLVPAAIIFAQWRFANGLSVLPSRQPPILECLGLSACGIAFLFMVMGLLYRRHRYAVWGLLLFLFSAFSFVAYELLFRAT